MRALRPFRCYRRWWIRRCRHLSGRLAVLRLPAEFVFPPRQIADLVLVRLRQGAEPLAFPMVQQRGKVSCEPKSHAGCVPRFDLSNQATRDPGRLAGKPFQFREKLALEGFHLGRKPLLLTIQLGRQWVNQARFEDRWSQAGVTRALDTLECFLSPLRFGNRLTHHFAYLRQSFWLNRRPASGAQVHERCVALLNNCAI